MGSERSSPIGPRTEERSPIVRVSIVAFLVLAGSLILPMFSIGTLQVRISDMVALGILPLFYLMLSGLWKRTRVIDTLSILLISMTGSTIFGYLFLGVPVSSRDITELIRMSMPLLILWSCAHLDEEDLGRTIVLFFKTATPVIIVFSYLQFFIPNALPRSLLHAYGGKIHTELLLTRVHPRIFATGTDANVGAMILALFLFYHFSEFIVRRRFVNLLTVILLLTAIGMAASKTVILAIVVSTAIYLCFSQQVKRRYKMLGTVFIAMFAFFVWTSVESVRIGFELFRSGQSVSWALRLKNFQDAIALFVQSPVFGWGPAKAVHTIVVDGDYFLFLRRFGILGMGLLLAFFGHSILLGRRLSGLKKGILTRNAETIALTFLLYSLVVPFVMITNNFFSGYQLMASYVVLLGYLEKVAMRMEDVGLDADCA